MTGRRHWWKQLVAVLVVGGAGVLFMGIQTYQEAPPIADFVGPDGRAVVEAEAVHRGKDVFLKYALMEYGSMFGDGAGRGPDFTADALHRTALAMQEFHAAAVGGGDSGIARLARDGAAELVRREIKRNGYDPGTGTIALTASQVHAWERYAVQVRDQFTGTGPESFKPAGYIRDPADLRDLAAFFFWGGWVSGAARPGSSSSYTHNWPYDAMAGNVLTPASVLWSVVGSLLLLLAVGLVLYQHGRGLVGRPGTPPPGDAEPAATAERLDAFRPTPTQRATYKFFAVAAVLFLVQVLGGVLTIHDFVGLTTFFGYDLRTVLPITITRSWHVQLSVLWIATCWIAGSIFLLPKVAPREPRGQVGLVNLLFTLLVVLVAGTLIGGFMGPHGMLGDRWRTLGNQGWEFVELGRLWQVMLFGALILWAAIVIRGVRPALRSLQPFSLPDWLAYAVATIVVLFVSSFVAQPRTNFVVADFWRWMVIHMWAECFFEVFTTVVIAYYMVLMGLIGRDAASRIVFYATLLFLGSGFLGISHNFYWNAKPEATLALGAVFSTMQVVPLLLLTLEAWKFRRMPLVAMRQEASAGRRPEFGLGEAFLFLVGVNFWNFVGAGVFGFIVNLPVVNYFEHGTYLTVNHGHAALMGVYGNLSIAAILFCGRHLVRSERWSPGLLRTAFWAMNVGLLLMVVLDLFPAGIYQFRAVLDHGLWFARAQGFVEGTPFQALTWMRLFGGAIFVLGGVLPLVWFMISRLGSLRPAVPVAAPEAVSAGTGGRLAPQPARSPRSDPPDLT